MKKIITVTSSALLIVLLFLLSKDYLKQIESDLHRDPKVSKQPTLPTPQAMPPSPSEDSEKNVIVEQINAETEMLSLTTILQAADCYSYIEKIKSEYSQNSNAYKLMDSLQEILLIDDLNFSKSINSNLRDLVPEEFLQKLSNGVSVAAITDSIGFQTMEFNEARDAVPRTSDSDSRRAVVQNLKESISPVTEELVPVFEVLTDLEINPEEEIELFKDIAMYLIMKTSAENRYQGLYEDLGENPRLLQNHLEVIGAIENVFGYRVSNLHGRDAPEIAERIGHLSVEKLNFAVLRNYNE